MPTVDVAMERSLRRGVLDLFVASLRPALERRDIEGQISDVKTAFSSWDNCMQVNYCKWPAIALIIIGGLIIISVTWCIIRCACCGRSCCCSCFSCLRCCGNCCGCCDPPRGRRKYLDEPYIPPNYGYKSQEPMHAGFNAGSTASPLSKGPGFPQYAEFDAGGKKDEDALPQMPSWEGAEQKKVLVEEEAVEMNALKRPETGGQAARPMSPHSSRSPVNRSPYGPPGGGPGSGGYHAASTVDYDGPYAQNAPAYSQPGVTYGEAEHGYGAGGFAMGPERRSPQAFNNVGYGGYSNINNYGQAHDYPGSGRQGSYDNYGAAHQQPYDSYDNFGGPQADQGYGIARHQTPSRELNNASPFPGDSRRSPAPQSPYGPDAGRPPAPRGPYGAESRRSPGPAAYGGSPPYSGGPDPRRSPAPQGDYGSRRSPAPRQGPYGGARSPPQRQYSNNGMHSPVGGVGDFGSNGPTPLRNEAGFDFTSGYSRPPAERSAAASPVNGPGGYRQPSPSAEFGGGGGGYSGYQPYKPA
ncbi:uncharacterized protein P884DRAFT_80006 [Thermothelomyces heterothallicus CBS 202.75]|uniref:uncharacterized protein n=1 Tax=Thermothelomyces heterothallicus CBS 202.75 TaxID=1149848 RepID=UPI00374383EF